MTGPWQALEQLFANLGILLLALIQLALDWWLVIAWLALALWAVNWRKLWPILGRGAWAPVVLGMVLTALVWSQVAPSDCACLGFTTVANFWWQLGAVALVVAVTFFCGWLQEALGWTPAEVDLEPHADAPASAHH